MALFLLRLFSALGVPRVLRAWRALPLVALALLGLASGAAMAAKGAGGGKLPYDYFAVGDPGALTDTAPKIGNDPQRKPSFLLMGGGP